MKQTRLIMGMPITVEIAAEEAANDLEAVFAYFRRVDERFSPYKETSEVSKINQGLDLDQLSPEMREVLELCEETKRLSRGYFDPYLNGRFDPSGLVKGWAILKAAEQLKARGHKNYYIEAGGDVEVSGQASEGQPWRIGIRNPFDQAEIIKIVKLPSGGLATSGTYIRGQHIYNPLKAYAPAERVKSLSVIGPNIYEADRIATAAFAMGLEGLNFIATLPGFEAYLVDSNKRAVFTPGFEAYVAAD